jgi:flagellar FliL protein
MAPRDDEDDDNEGDGASVGGKKKLLVIILILLLLGGGGAGLYFSGMLGGAKEKKEGESAEAAKEGEAAAEAGEHGEAGAAAVPLGPVFYEMPEFLVNLSTTGQKVSFLKMKVTLELENQAAVAKIDARKPRIQDAFNTYLRELRASDLVGSAGIYRLREELLLRVNKAVEPDRVTDILFGEIIVQ